MIVIRLPFPPTANHAVKHTHGRHYLSKQAKEYRDQVLAEVLTMGKRPPVTGKMAVATLWTPPDRRRRDGHNLTKTLFDALTYAGVWVDDEQVYVDAVMRMPPGPGGVMVLVDGLENREGVLRAAAAMFDAAWEIKQEVRK